MNRLSENNNFVLDDNIYSKDELLDLYRLQKQLLIEDNIVATLEECANIWMNYSNDLAASWLFFPKKDEDILSQIKGSEYFDSFENYSI